MPFIIFGDSYESNTCAAVCLIGAFFFLVLARDWSRGNDQAQTTYLKEKYAFEIFKKKLEKKQHGNSYKAKHPILTTKNGITFHTGPLEKNIITISKNNIKRIWVDFSTKNTLAVSVQGGGFSTGEVAVISIYVENKSNQKFKVFGKWDLEKEIYPSFKILNETFENEFQISSEETIFRYIRKYNQIINEAKYRLLVFFGIITFTVLAFAIL